jgi:cytochrome P450
VSISERPIQKSKYLDYDFGSDYDDPYPLYRKLRQEEPVMVGDFLDRFGLPSQTGFKVEKPKFTLFRYADVMAVLRDSATYSSRCIGEGLGSVYEQTLITAMDGEAHRRLRGLLSPCFDMRPVSIWGERLFSPVIRREFVEPLRARPEKKAELVVDAAGFPMRLTYEILGLPTDAVTRKRFATLAVHIKESMLPVPSDRAAVAATEARAMIRSAVAERRKAGHDMEGDDLMALLSRATFEGDALDDDEIADFIFMLEPPAVETTTLSFQNMMALLLTRPALLERIRDDRSLVVKAVNETMRLESPATFLARVATRPVEIAGVQIPAGAGLSLATGSANRDESVFGNPEEFDIDRKAVPALGFGFGPHMCVGHHVARLELSSALNALLDLLPNLRLDPDYPPPDIRGVIKRGPAAIHVTWG